MLSHVLENIIHLGLKVKNKYYGILKDLQYIMSVNFKISYLTLSKKSFKFLIDEV